MKDKSKKHDHKGTKLLKLSIFFTIMLAPILAIAFKCGYATFNKNAYQSYSTEQIELKASTLQINENSTYYYNWFDDTTGQTNNSTALITYDTISITLDPSCTRFRFTNDGKLSMYDVNNSQIGFVECKTCTFTVKENITLTQQPWFKTYLVIETQQKLDKTFYYAIDEMQESTLFNWTENTAIYTPIHAMTSGLGITTDAIAILLTYWMYITLIYIVFDIVIELFTYLTHTLMGQPM